MLRQLETNSELNVEAVNENEYLNKGERTESYPYIFDKKTCLNHPKNPVKSGGSIV